MKQFKRICGKLLFPHFLLILLVSALSAVGLGWVFLTGRETHWLACPIYALSAYAMTVLCIWLVPAIFRAARENRQHLRALTPEEKETGFRRSLVSGMIMNLLYASFHILIGTGSRSAWIISQGAYQLVMALIHLTLMYYERRRRNAVLSRERQRIGWKGFRTCGIWLLILHLTMTGLVFQMVWRRETKNYPGVMIFAVAAYTFYKLTVAILRVLRHRGNADALRGAARNIDLSEALMNLFTLQAALLRVFGTAPQEEFRFLMNSLTGGAVCLLTVGGAVGMICHGSQNIKQQSASESPFRGC